MRQDPAEHSIQCLMNYKVPSSWQVQTLFLALSILSTLPSNFLGWSCHNHKYFPSANFLGFSLCAASPFWFSALQILAALVSQESVLSLQLQESDGIHMGSHSLHCILEDLSREWARTIKSYFTGFSFLRDWCPFAWYPVLWLPLSGCGLILVFFFKFWFIFFLDIPGKRVNPDTVTPSWPEEKLSYFTHIYPHTNTIEDYLHQNIKRIYLWVEVLWQFFICGVCVIYIF